MKRFLVITLVILPQLIWGQVFYAFSSSENDFGTIRNIHLRGDSLIFTGSINGFMGLEGIGVASYKNGAPSVHIEGFGFSVVSSCLYQDKLVITGLFSNVMDVVNTNSIASWNGEEWESLGGDITGGGYPRSGISMNDTLYLGGNFGEVAGIEVESFASYSNGTFQAEESVLGIINGPLHLEVFEGELWGAGEFVVDTEGNLIVGVGRFDGTHWNDVDGGVSGGGRALFADEEEGIIYVGHAGEFAQGGNLPSLNGISAWNGEEWSAIGEYNDMTPSVRSIIKYRDQLYAGGLFQIDDTPCLLSYFDGYHWQCVEGAGGPEADGAIWDMVIHQDTLFGVGSFDDIAELDANGKFKFYMHPDSVQWGVPDNVDELQDISWLIYPNPTDGQLTIEVDAQNQYAVEVRNTKGQLIVAKTILPELSNEFLIEQKGLHFVHLYFNQKLVGVKKIISQ